jgi:hypothetical protein
VKANQNVQFLFLPYRVVNIVKNVSMLAKAFEGLIASWLPRVFLGQNPSIICFQSRLCFFKERKKEKKISQ